MNHLNRFSHNNLTILGMASIVRNVASSVFSVGWIA